MCSPVVLPCVALVPPLHKHTHTESQSSCKKKTRDKEVKHGEDKAGMQQSTHLHLRPVAFGSHLHSVACKAGVRTHAQRRKYAKKIQPTNERKYANT